MATPAHLRTLLAAALLLPLLARGDAGAIKKPTQNETAAFFSAADPCSSGHAAGDARPPTRKGELVLVTGGSGFIGSNLVDRLLSLGYRVRVLDNLSTGDAGYLDLRNAGLEFVIGDIRRRSVVRQALQGVTGVFHLAAMSKVKPSLTNPTVATYCVDVNSVGTAIVLEQAKALGIKKVVYAASSTYYGNRVPPLQEDMLFRPSSPYAASKYMGELIMTSYNHVYGLPTLNLRFFMVYGPRQPSTGAYAIVTGVFVDQFNRDQPLTIEGDGTHYRDFIHVEDIVRGLIMGYQSKINGTTVNLGTGSFATVQQVADLVSSKQVHVAERPFDLIGTLADTCRAKKLLKFETKKEFRAEMSQLVQQAKDGVHHLAPFWKGVKNEAGVIGFDMTLKQRNHYAKHVLPGTNSRVRQYESLKGASIEASS